MVCTYMDFCCVGTPQSSQLRESKIQAEIQNPIGLVSQRTKLKAATRATN